MAIETANLVHALANLNLNNPPSVVFAEGIDTVLGINRIGAGEYEVAAVPPLDILQGVGQATLQSGVAGAVTVRVRDLSLGPRNILIQTFDMAGAPADLGRCALTLFRYPTQG